MKKLIYIVDDEPLQLHYLHAALRKINYNVEAFSDANVMLQALGRRCPDAAVVDLIMPEFSGVELIREIRKRSPRLPLIAVTAYPEIESAMGAIRAGANDYLKKPFQGAELQLVVERLLVAEHLRDNLESIVDENAHRYSFEALVGTSPVVENLRVGLRRLADMQNINVLIAGENGSGKSFAGRILHYAHPDPTKRLIEINCANHSKEELEAELFGWDEQQSDGSSIHHPSLCEIAEGGTIMLDYLAHADMETQRKLHERLLQIDATDAGDDDTPRCRIIAISMLDPDTEEGRAAFHPPLLEALSLFKVSVPPLREREDDVISLAERFIASADASGSVRVRGLTDEAKETLRAYAWPGNIRELKSVIERALVTTTTQLIDKDDLNIGSSYHTKGDETAVSDTLASLRELEIQQIKRVLAYTNGDVTKAAQILGISRKSLWERRRRYSLK